MPPAPEGKGSTHEQRWPNMQQQDSHLCALYVEQQQRMVILVMFMPQQSI
jgi:hypothetical protein